MEYNITIGHVYLTLVRAYNASDQHPLYTLDGKTLVSDGGLETMYVCFNNAVYWGKINFAWGETNAV